MPVGSSRQMNQEDIYLYPVNLVKKDLTKSLIFAMLAFIFLAVLGFFYE